MKIFFLCTLGLVQIAALAQSPVTLTIDAGTRGAAVPDDFVGLSFETSNLLPDKNGGHFFSAENQPLVNLFRDIGIKNIRVGGGTVDMAKYAVPDQADIDHLFAFAKAADVKVIYSFRLLNGDKTNAAALAGYIWQHYHPQLAAFAIGNEPDWRSYHNQDPKITSYPSYLADWKDFATAIVASAPGAKFAGPDTGSNYPVPGAQDTRYDDQSWTRRFADDETKSGIIAAIFQHDYVGQSAKGVSVPAAVDAMLSPGWIGIDCPALYHAVLAFVAADGLAYRMTECNDYTGGVDGASNAFASALWALDYMHWWAAHGCAGVNFHNKRWIYTDAIYLDSAGDLQTNPKACALKAFGLGSHGGIITSVKLSNPKRVNMDCYAVGGPADLYITIINKTHGSTSADTIVTIQPQHFSAAGGQYVVLESKPDGDCLAKDAVLGGATITSTASWRGSWTPLDVSKTGQCELTVKSASAAVVHIY